MALVLLAACGPKDKGKGDRGPPTVGYVITQPGRVPLTAQLTGRVTAFQTSEVRPQVNGIILRRLFEEGSMVRAGQTLYEIDPRLFSAASNQAKANLAAAEATAEAARIRAERLKPLATSEAVSQQDYTDAVAAARQAEAAILQMRAQLEAANVSLGYTKVAAPISGRIGRSFFTEGALVTANQTSPLAIIQRLDPIFVDIQQSSADLLTLRRQLAAAGAPATSVEVELILEDGSRYAPHGVVQFSEVMVSETTGTVTLRARFPNPAGILLPGMFVRAELAQQVQSNAYLVPQPAVLRDPVGRAHVMLAGADGKAIERMVEADRIIGQNWVITGGLNPGDKVIVQGLENLKPGARIKAVPADSPQVVRAPGPGGPSAPGK